MCTSNMFPFLTMRAYPAEEYSQKKYLFGNKARLRHCIPAIEPYLSCCSLKYVFMFFLKGNTMSSSPSTPKTDSNEAPKTNQPGAGTPTPQQNQGDQPAKPNEQQK